MRVVHILKTSDGADWALRQVEELVRLGVKVHAVLPRPTGKLMDGWHRSGAALHFVNLDFPASAPWKLPGRILQARKLADRLKPDVIHIHHFGPAMLMRAAMPSASGPLRIFQVPGPLHLEHAFFRRWDLSSAGPNDYWIATSRFILGLYRAAGVAGSRLFLSYHTIPREHFGVESAPADRSLFGLPHDAFVVGNVSYMYPPRWYLGEKTGLKRHEDLITALGIALGKSKRIFGILAGGQWGEGHRYEDQLRSMASTTGNGRIIMPGALNRAQVSRLWPLVDCAVHVPASENCGGVVEPMLAGVPVIASTTGGLPEVVIDGLTGSTVPAKQPGILAKRIVEVMESIEAHRGMARRGAQLVGTMFNVSRTAPEVLGIYRFLLGQSDNRPAGFSSLEFH
jgi:glycosyltransferase involved in cell wall biosynthesis